MRLELLLDAPYKDVADELAALVQRTPIFKHFATMRTRGGTSSAMNPRAFERIVRGPAGFQLSSALAGGELTLSSMHNDGTLSITVFALDAMHARVAPDLDAVARAFFSGIGRPVVLPSSGIHPEFTPDLPWDPVPGRPDAPYLRYENVVDYLDPRALAHFRGRAAYAAIERLLQATPPPFVKRVAHDGVTALMWPRDLTDPAGLAVAREQHERWMAGVVQSSTASSV